MDVRAFNRDAWNRQVDSGNRWTVAVSADEITRAKRGEWSVVLTPSRPVPRCWFPATLDSVKILCLASGGGQQVPILAAAGATVTVLDNSPKQLAQDRAVAEREGLTIHAVEGDMADLSMFDEEGFDLIFHPCSNCFVADVRPVWQEAHRVLRTGGYLLSGFTNPVRYVFDERLEQQGQLVVRHCIPYSDLTSISEEERDEFLKQRPLDFGHTLEDQIGGQLEAGFRLTNFFQDRYVSSEDDELSKYIATFIATRALKC